MLTVDHLHFSHPGRPMFTDWSHRFEAGLTWVQGVNGCGKSTLLRLLSGALPPQLGRLCAAGFDLQQSPQDYRRQVAWFSPDEVALDHLRPLEYAGFLAGLYPHFDDELLQRLVADLGLTPHLGKPISALSTGTRRKVALVSALALNTPIVLLDEPLAALDAASVRVVRQVLVDLAQDGETCLVVTSHESLGEAAKEAQVLSLGS